MMIVSNFGSNNSQDYQRIVNQGGRFSYYSYCLSFIFFSSKNITNVYLVRNTKDRLLNIFKYGMISLLCGWWAFPFGPIYTLQCLNSTIRGGHDVTLEVLDDAKMKLNPKNQYF